MTRSRCSATISTVAARAGSSISTVSAALNNVPVVAPATREEIVRIAAELGYEADPQAWLMRAAYTELIGVTYALGQAFQTELCGWPLPRRCSLWAWARACGGYPAAQ